MYLTHTSCLVDEKLQKHYESERTSRGRRGGKHLKAAQQCVRGGGGGGGPQVTVFWIVPCWIYTHGEISDFWSVATYVTVCMCQWCHFSCSRAGMLMFQPIACRSKPHVNKLHDWFSSFHAVQHTIRLWPCTHTFKINKKISFKDADRSIKSIGFWGFNALSPSCCCGGVWPASRRSCRTVALVGCRAAERWSSGWRRRWSWNSTSRELTLNLGQI